MARTGLGAAEAVDHFWPGADPDTRGKLAAKFRVWKQRAGSEPRQRTPNVPQGEDDAPPPTRIVVDDSHSEPGRLERVAFLEWQLSRLVATMDAVMASGNVGRVAQVDARISEVRQHLDVARSTGKPVALDRNPATVTEEVERRDKRIRHLAQAARAAKERDL